MCHCTNFYHVYNNNFLLKTFLHATFVSYSSHTTTRYYSHNPFLKQYTYSSDLHNTQSQLHRLNNCWLLFALTCLFICIHLQSTECSQSIRYMISPSRDLYSDSLCISILIFVCLSRLLLLLIYLESVRCICYCVHTVSSAITSHQISC